MARHVTESTAADRIAAEQAARDQRIDQAVGSGQQSRITDSQTPRR